MSAPIRFHRNDNVVTPSYTVEVAGVEVGRVYRTGSLPSCARWWVWANETACASYEARSGREWSRPTSSASRSDAVKKFLESLDIANPVG